MLNDVILVQYGKNINKFLSYLIKVGEHLEEYEKCNKLLKLKDLVIMAGD